jgi:hypothetical protein
LPSLDEVRQQIVDSGVDDWNVIVCWGANSGPSYLDQLSIWKGGGGDRWGLEVNSHTIRGVYKPDVALGIACGLDFMPNSDGEAEKLSFDWAQRFADKTVTGSWVDVFWDGSLVDRELVYNADGGRALLPAPHAMYHSDSITEPEIIGEYVTQWEYHIARVVAGFESHGDYEADVKRVGFTTLDR